MSRAFLLVFINNFILTFFTSTMASRSAASAIAAASRVRPTSVVSAAGSARSYGYASQVMGNGPLFSHPLGHAPTQPMLPGYEMTMHATTILSVRKAGKVVRTQAKTNWVACGLSSSMLCVPSSFRSALWMHRVLLLFPCVCMREYTVPRSALRMPVDRQVPAIL